MAYCFTTITSYCKHNTHLMRPTTSTVFVWPTFLSLFLTCQLDLRILTQLGQPRELMIEQHPVEKDTGPDGTVRQQRTRSQHFTAQECGHLSYPNSWCVFSRFVLCWQSIFNLFYASVQILCSSPPHSYNC